MGGWCDIIISVLSGHATAWGRRRCRLTASEKIAEGAELIVVLGARASPSTMVAEVILFCSSYIRYSFH